MNIEQADKLGQQAAIDAFEAYTKGERMLLGLGLELKFVWHDLLGEGDADALAPVSLGDAANDYQIRTAFNRSFRAMAQQIAENMDEGLIADEVEDDVLTPELVLSSIEDAVKARTEEDDEINNDEKRAAEAQEAAEGRRKIEAAREKRDAEEIIEKAIHGERDARLNETMDWVRNNCGPDDALHDRLCELRVILEEEATK